MEVREFKRKRHIGIIIKRLCDVILYLLICFFVFDYLFDYTVSPLETVFSTISLDLNISATIIIYSGITLLFSWILIEFGGAPINLKSLCYIPTWLIIYFGTILFFYLFKDRYQILIQNVDQSLVIVSVASMFPFTKLVHYIYFNFLNKGRWDKKIEITNSKLSLLEWILSDSPVDLKNDDRFERLPVAEKIASCIINNENIALVGQYGSGKTTVLRAAENIHLISSEYHYLICHIDSWGRRHNNLSVYLLEHGLNELKSKIDVIPFIDIPDNFVNAISGGGFWSNLISITKRGISPVDVLSKLDDVLTWHKVKLIFIIEDIDRNKDKTLLEVTLPSLLDRLSNTKNIRFALAIDSQYFSPKWLYRVTTRVQNLPDIEINKVLNLIDEFRNKMFSSYEYIDPVPAETHKRRLLNVYDCTDKGSHYVTGSFGENIFDAWQPSPVYILAKLLSNPREMKLVLRETAKMWEHLVGEVYLDELLFINAIKYTVPELNQILVNDINIFKDNTQKKVNTLLGVKKKEASEQMSYISKKLIKCKMPIKIDEVHIILDFLFPGWLVSGRENIKMPQGVVNTEPTNYWNRCNLGYLNEIERHNSDQTILKKIKSFPESDREMESLSGLIVKDKIYPNKIEQFKEMFKETDKLLILISSVFSAILIEYREHSSDNKPGYYQLRNVIKTHPIRQDEYKKWFLSEYAKAVNVSFRFSNDLIENFSSLRQGDRICDKLYFVCVDIAKAQWKTMEINDFIKTFDAEFPYSLFHFTVLYSNKKHDISKEIVKLSKPILFTHSKNEYLFFPDFWKELGTLLLKAAKINPEVILPQITLILLDFEVMPFDDNDYLDEIEKDQGIFKDKIEPQCKFHHNVGEAWFGEDYISLMEIFSYKHDFSFLSDKERLKMLIMEFYAAKYLAEKSKACKQMILETLYKFCKTKQLDG